ncbi:MAG: ABC transporter permease, partial [Acidobacteriota bacterium]
MTTATEATTDGARRPVVESPARMVWRRFRRHRLALLSAIVLLGLGIACLSVPLFVSEQESLQVDFSQREKPPSLAHPFGTTTLGRDYLVTCLYGGRISLEVGLFATLVAVFVGTFLGAIAGWAGGWVDNLIMRGVDLMLAIPIFFVLLLLASYYGTSLLMVTLIIGLTSWTDVCRLVRAEFLSLREKEFVEAARALGVPAPRIVMLHLLPNAASPLIVAATLGMARAIIVESALSYLGFGVQPPIVSWGSLLRTAQADLQTLPWLATFPGALIFIVVLACNFLGDGLRDALDPRTV